MPPATSLLAFGLVALAMVLTPGTNMLYLVSRSIVQGRRAGLVSLADGPRRARRPDGARRAPLSRR
jgi:hypothetical protein